MNKLKIETGSVPEPQAAPKRFAAEALHNTSVFINGVLRKFRAGEILPDVSAEFMAEQKGKHNFHFFEV